MIIYSDESACEGEGLAVGCEDSGVDVACGRQEDSDRYKDDAEDGCYGGDEELYFDIRFFMFEVRGLTAVRVRRRPRLLLEVRPLC